MTEDADNKIVAHVMIAAGGTGGHLFPAHALAQELHRRDVRVDLITDRRGHRYGDAFPAVKTYEVPAASLRLRPVLKILPNMFTIVRGIIAAQSVLHRVRPAVVVAFGGYPTLPPLIAALLQGVPICLHEQNAVMGRVNRLLAPFSAAIASTFPNIRNAGRRAQAKTIHTGNPVRDPVLALRKSPYEPPAPRGHFRLLVFGGSQGASVFADVVPAGIAELPAGIRSSLRVVQQTRVEDLERVRSAYEKIGVEAEIAPFFKRLPERMADAHLIIARAGASTVSELSIVGRPAILVPLPHSLDNDQLYNAHHFVYSGGGWLVEQNEFNAERLAALLIKLRYSPDELNAAATAAAELAKPDAVAALADMVLRQIRQAKSDDFEDRAAIRPASDTIRRRRHGGNKKGDPARRRA